MDEISEKGYGKKDKVIGLIKIGRPWYLLLVIPYLTAPALVAAGDINLFLQKIIPFYVVIFLCLTGTNALNDFCDRELDKSRYPFRPIPSGRVSPTEALVDVIIRWSICLVIVWIFLTSAFFMILVFFTVLIIQNSTKKLFKHNDLILALAPFCAILTSWSIYSKLSGLAFMYAAAFYFFDVAHAGSESFEDYEADKSFGYHSLAVDFGPEKTSKVVPIAIVITTILLSSFVYLVNLSYICLIIVIMIGAWCAGVSALLIKDHSSERGIKTHFYVSVTEIAISLTIIIGQIALYLGLK